MKENIQYLLLASLVRISKGEQHAACSMQQQQQQPAAELR